MDDRDLLRAQIEKEEERRRVLAAIEAEEVRRAQSAQEPINTPIEQTNDKDALKAQIQAEELKRATPNQTSEDTGFFSNLGAGAEKGKHDWQRRYQIYQALQNGQIPEGIPVEELPELGFNRKSIGQFLGRATVNATPSIAATLGGASLGAAAGTAVAPGIGTAVGGIAGGVTASASEAALSSYLDAYNEARLHGASGEDADKYARKVSGVAGAISAITFPLGKIGAKDTIIKQVAKQIPIQATTAEAENIARNVIAKEEGIDVDREILDNTKETLTSAGIFGTAQAIGQRMVGAKPTKQQQPKPKNEPPIWEPPTGIEPPPHKPKEPPNGPGRMLPGEQLIEGEIIPRPEGAKSPFVTNLYEDAKKRAQTPIEPPPKKQEPKFSKAPEPESNLPVPIDNNKKQLAPGRIIKDANGVTIDHDTDRIYKKVFSKGGEDMPPQEQNLAVKTSKFIKDYLYNSPFETAVFDWQAPLKHITNKGEPVKRESQNIPYTQARFANHMTGILNAAYKHGTPYWDKSEQIIQLKPKSKGFMDIINPVLKEEQHAKDFQTYMYGKRVQNQGLIEQGREHNITAAEASTAMALGEKYPYFKDVSKDISNYVQSTLDIMESTGLINKKDRAVWEHMDYVPFYRDLGEKQMPGKARSSLAGQKDNIHYLSGGVRQYLVFDGNKAVFRTTSRRQANNEAKRIGSTAKVEDVGPVTNDLYENLLRNTAYALTASQRNVAAVNNINAGIKAGVVRPVSTRSVAQRRRDGEMIVSAKKNGIERFYQVTNEPFYTALTQTQFKDKSNISSYRKVFGGIKKLVSRALLADPAILANIVVKDLARTMIIGKNKKSIPDLIKNYIASFRHEFGGKLDPRLIDMMSAGGDTGYFDVNEEHLIKDEIDKVRKANGIYIAPIWYKRFLPAVGKALSPIRKAVTASEKAHKLTHYDAAIKAGKGKREAIFEAMDLMDYAMKGNSETVKVIVETVPFFGTLLQDIHKVTREMVHNKFNNRTMKNLAFIGTIAMLNTLINAIPDDDEETEANNYESRAEWQKNNYMMFDLYKILGLGSSSLGRERAKAKGLGDTRWIQIQKPWSLGMFGMTLPERITNAIIGEDYKKEAWMFGQAALDQLYMNPAPPLLREIVEQVTNYDFYSGNRIVPRNRENFVPELQYGPKTTTFSKALGEAINVSPARIDHLLKSLTGSIGTTLAMLPDVFNGKAKTEKSWSDSYFVKKYLGGEIAKDNAYKHELYEIAHQMEIAKNSLDKFEEKENEGKIENYEKKFGWLDNIPDPTEIKKQISEIENEITEINDSDELSSKEKKEQIDELYKERNLILAEFHRDVQAAKEEAKRNS